jgi:type IV pilus assembly protein PilW
MNALRHPRATQPQLTMQVAHGSICPKPAIKQRGLSLVELLVALAISLFLLLAVSLVYVNSKNSFAFANNTTRMAQDGAYAIEAISRDVRMAGYSGCAGTNLSVSTGPDGVLGNSDDVADNPTAPESKSKPKLLNVASYNFSADDMPNPFTSPVYSANSVILGFTNTNASVSTAQAVVASTTSPPAYTLEPNQPILYLAGGSPQAVQIRATVTNTTTPASNGRNSGNSVNIGNDPHSYPDNAWMLIADCRSSEIFRAKRGSSGSDTFLDSQTTLPSGAGTSTFIFQNTYGTDAIVTPLVTSIYFIARRAGATTPSLYVRQFNGAVTAQAQELVPNIEAITYQYGENITNGSNGVPTYRADVYRTDASQVVDWSRVVSLRFAFIVVSEDANLSAGTQPATIPWFDNIPAYTPPSTTDRRERRAYTATVSIRNRTGL